MFMELHDMATGQEISLNVNNIDRITRHSNGQNTEIYPIQSLLASYAVSPNGRCTIDSAREGISGWIEFRS
jgi:hypothetical protein